MRRSVLIVGLAVVIGLTMGSEAFARRHSRGRRGGGGFGGTAASAALMGTAAVLRAQGMANLQNSQAAINWEKAKTMEIENRLRWTETYFKMRQVNHAMQLAERGPAITAEQAIKLAHDALPSRLRGNELDPVTGRIVYPTVLQDPRYDTLRVDVDAFFRRRAEAHGSVDFNDLQEIETILDLLHGELRSNATGYAAGEYGHAATFIERLKREATLPMQ